MLNFRYVADNAGPYMEMNEQILHKVESQNGEWFSFIEFLLT